MDRSGAGVCCRGRWSVGVVVWSLVGVGDVLVGPVGGDDWVRGVAVLVKGLVADCQSELLRDDAMEPKGGARGEDRDELFCIISF